MDQRSSWTFLKNDRGSAMVEFAIAGSVFSVILLAILEFGFAAWQKNAVASDARDATRYAIVHGAASGRTATPDSVSRYVKSRTSLDTGTITVYTSWSPDKKPGSEVTVSVAHTAPRRGLFIAAHRDSATSRLRVFF